MMERVPDTPISVIANKVRKDRIDRDWIYFIYKVHNLRGVKPKILFWLFLNIRYILHQRTSFSWLSDIHFTKYTYQVHKTLNCDLKSNPKSL